MLVVTGTWIWFFHLFFQKDLGISMNFIFPNWLSLICFRGVGFNHQPGFHAYLHANHSSLIHIDGWQEYLGHETDTEATWRPVERRDLLANFTWYAIWSMNIVHMKCIIMWVKQSWITHLRMVFIYHLFISSGDFFGCFMASFYPRQKPTSFGAMQVMSFEFPGYGLHLGNANMRPLGCFANAGWLRKTLFQEWGFNLVELIKIDLEPKKWLYALDAFNFFCRPIWAKIRSHVTEPQLVQPR